MVTHLETFLSQIDKKNYPKYHQRKRSPQNMECDPKGVPKWDRNRCNKSSKNNAKTDNEKDHANHQKSYFSEW